MSSFPLSPSKNIGGLVFVSGQIGQKDGQLVSDNLEEQLIQAIELQVQSKKDIEAFKLERMELEEHKKDIEEMLTKEFNNKSNEIEKDF